MNKLKFSHVKPLPVLLLLFATSNPPSCIYVDTLENFRLYFGKKFKNHQQGN